MACLLKTEKQQPQFSLQTVAKQVVDDQKNW